MHACIAQNAAHADAGVDLIGGSGGRQHCLMAVARRRRCIPAESPPLQCTPQVSTRWRREAEALTKTL
eukprot:262621-Chlamydomonas_euryale.AAC.6